MPLGHLVGIVLGLSSAVSIGGNQAFLSRPLMTVRPSVVTYFSGLLSLLFFLIAMVLTDQAASILAVPPGAALILVGYGILQFGVVRLLMYSAIKNIGANLTSVITPLEVVFAALFAVSVISESLNLGIASGTVLIVVGAMLLNPGAGATKRGGNKKLGVVFAISAALTFGLATTLVKAGLTLFPHFIPSIFISCVSGVVFNAFILSPRNFASSLNKIPRSAMVFILISTVCTAATQFFKFAALSYFSVVMFAPLMGTYPIFVLIMTRAFAGETEVFDSRTMLSIPLVIVGAILVGIFSS